MLKISFARLYRPKRRGVILLVMESDSFESSLPSVEVDTSGGKYAVAGR